MSRFVTVEYFAEQTALSVHQVYRRIRQGRIKARNFGTPKHRLYRIPVSELDAA